MAAKGQQRLWATLPIYHEGEAIAQHAEVTGRFDGELLQHMVDTGQVTSKEPKRSARRGMSEVKASTRARG